MAAAAATTQAAPHALYLVQPPLGAENCGPLQGRRGWRGVRWGARTGPITAGSSPPRPYTLPQPVHDAPSHIDAPWRPLLQALSAKASPALRRPDPGLADPAAAGEGAGLPLQGLRARRSTTVAKSGPLGLKRGSGQGATQQRRATMQQRAEQRPPLPPAACALRRWGAARAVALCMCTVPAKSLECLPFTCEGHRIPPSAHHPAVAAIGRARRQRPEGRRRAAWWRRARLLHPLHLPLQPAAHHLQRVTPALQLQHALPLQRLAQQRKGAACSAAGQGGRAADSAGKGGRHDRQA